MKEEIFLIFAFSSFLAALIIASRKKPFKKIPRFFQLLSFILLLFCALVLSPLNISQEFLQFIAALTVIFTAFVMAINYVFEGSEAIKQKISLRKNAKISDLEAYLQEVLQALVELSENRDGALIIIKRKDDLENLMVKKIDFDAEVKSEIIFSLFAKSSSVHDGALIIDDGRIKMVNAILPLSTSEALPMGLGTRHRSAIGITERCDCLALIVSEQTQSLSIAFKGSLVRADSDEELASLIKQALAGKSLLKIKS